MEVSKRQFITALSASVVFIAGCSDSEGGLFITNHTNDSIEVDLSVKRSSDNKKVFKEIISVPPAPANQTGKSVDFDVRLKEKGVISVAVKDGPKDSFNSPPLVDEGGAFIVIHEERIMFYPGQE